MSKTSKLWGFSIRQISLQFKYHSGHNPLPCSNAYMPPVLYGTISDILQEVVDCSKYFLSYTFEVHPVPFNIGIDDVIFSLYEGS